MKAFVLVFSFIYHISFHSYSQSNDWRSLSSELNAGVLALYNFDNKLFAGGHFTLSGKTITNHIAFWNGSEWSALGKGVSGGINPFGALDLRATKFERDFKILNPALLTPQQKKEIVDAFEPILNRNRMSMEQELIQADRINFERVLFEVFEISQYYNSIKDSLIHLFKIRFAVKDI